MKTYTSRDIADEIIAGKINRDTKFVLESSASAKVADLVAERDEYKKALHEISTQDYRGNGSQESHIARRVLAAMRKGGGA